VSSTALSDQFDLAAKPMIESAMPDDSVETRLAVAEARIAELKRWMRATIAVLSAETRHHYHVPDGIDGSGIARSKVVFHAHDPIPADWPWHDEPTISPSTGEDS
jgi:hypothetical protein